MRGPNPVVCSQAGWHAVTACAHRRPGDKCLVQFRSLRYKEDTDRITDSVCNSFFSVAVLVIFALNRQAQRRFT